MNSIRLRSYVDRLAQQQAPEKESAVAALVNEKRRAFLGSYEHEKAGHDDNADATMYALRRIAAAENPAVLPPPDEIELYVGDDPEEEATFQKGQHVK